MDWTIVLWILGVLVAAAAVLLIIASTKPDTFRVERRTTINAPPEKIFPLLNDFHEWPKWSPWEKKDPNMRRTHSGAPNGKGAIYAWEGDKNVGKGSMEILESTPPSRLFIALNFLAPWQAKNQVEFTLMPGGAGAATVNWVMTGQNVFMGKVMSTVMNIDKMVGKDFEQGLVNLKAAAERA